MIKTQEPLTAELQEKLSKLEEYLKVRKGPWELSYEEGKDLIIK